MSGMLELDPQFMQGLRLLHSPNKDSAEQLRSLLDEAIRQKHGPGKMLCNVLHKKYTMEEPVLSDHSSGSSTKKSKGSSSASSKHSSKSSKNSSPVNLPPRETTPDILQADDTFALELEDDLTCVVCKGMDVSARNRLVECVECHSLYHQECHTPHILDTQIDDPRLVWYCSNCSKTQQTSKERSSPKTVIEGKSKDHNNKKSTNSSGGKHGDKYKSNSNQSQPNSGGSTPTGSSASSNTPKVTPNINIVSGDRRLRDSKKGKQEKRSNSSSSGSKHSSSSNTNSSSSSSTNKSAQEKSLLYKMKSGSE